jgi:hypothetical protein
MPLSRSGESIDRNTGTPHIELVVLQANLSDVGCKRRRRCRSRRQVVIFVQQVWPPSSLTAREDAKLWTTPQTLTILPL